ncbi:MAG: hypothetical protein ACI8PT_004187 [Gammaproteobacteria bacterium]|jgi:hypothetical protein
MNLSISTEGAPMVFSSDVVIGDFGVSFDTTANGNPAGADITFNGRLDSQTGMMSGVGELNPLTLLAGTGGDISFNGAVGEASATSGMGDLTVGSGNDVTLVYDRNLGNLSVTNAGIVTFVAGTVSLTGVTADGAGGSTPTTRGLDPSGAGNGIVVNGSVGVDTRAASAAGLNIDLTGAPITGGGNTLDLNAGSGGRLRWRRLMTPH